MLGHMAYSAKESYLKHLPWFFRTQTTSLISKLFKSHLSHVPFLDTSLFLGKFPPPEITNFDRVDPLPCETTKSRGITERRTLEAEKPIFWHCLSKFAVLNQPLFRPFEKEKHLQHLPTWNVLEMSYSRKSTHFKLTWPPKKATLLKKKVIFQPCLFLRCYSWKLQGAQPPSSRLHRTRGAQQSLGSLRPDHPGDPWVPVDIKKWEDEFHPAMGPPEMVQTHFLGGALIQSWCKFFIGGFEWFPENPRNLQTLRTLPEPMDPYNLDDPLEVRINGL